jgi:hypothetical protein
MPAGVHLNKQLNARVPEEIHAIIHHFQDEWKVSQARVLEALAYEMFGRDNRKLAGALRRYRGNAADAA